VLLLAVPAVSSGGQAPRAELQNFSCRNGLDPVNRAMGVTAVMRPVTGTWHMSARFELFVTRGHSSTARVVHGGDLGVWINPRNPTLGQLPGDVWNLRKTVIQLGVPATYRFQVQFRWQDSQGQVLATMTNYTRRCAERELRPDLAVRSISVQPADSTHDFYTAIIANQGNSSAGPFEVLFAPGDGSATITRTVSVLAARSSLIETFEGPLCRSSTAPSVTADAAMQVDDLNRANNTMTAVCPASGAG
jgi:hypothetical protein